MSLIGLNLGFIVDDTSVYGAKAQLRTYSDRSRHHHTAIDVEHLPGNISSSRISG